MILDLNKFIDEEKPYWEELDKMLLKIEIKTSKSSNLKAATRFNYLYQRACADLNQLTTFSSNQEIKKFLEDLVSRAYAAIHDVHDKSNTFNLFKWFFITFPTTFREHVKVFYLVVAITFAGMLFGGLSVALDANSKDIILPFSHLIGNPSDRVANEEKSDGKRLEGHKSQFSAQLMTHNIKVSILVLAMGLTFGVGTIILLFYNGIILGAVCVDYILAGETTFLIGWLLPHGATEIPSILIAGQAGLILAHALIGKGNRLSRKQRLRNIMPHLTTLIGGVSIMLVYSGIVEAFLSQYHEPILPYWIKISIGVVELILLITFFMFMGRNKKYNVAT